MIPTSYGWSLKTSASAKILKCKYLYLGGIKRSGLTVNFSELGFRVHSRGDMTENQLDEILNILYGRTVYQEKNQLNNLRRLHKSFTEYVSQIIHATIHLLCITFLNVNTKKLC